MKHNPIIYSLLVLVFMTESLTFAETTPFVYVPDRLSSQKDFYVDDSGINVITENRILTEAGIEYRLVIYELDHQRALNWFVESDEWMMLIDSVVTEDSVFVLHNTAEGTLTTAMSRYDRSNGELIWRKSLGLAVTDMNFIRVDDQQSRVIVAGTPEDQSEMLWFDFDGEPLFEWTKDLAVEDGTHGSDWETAHELLITDNGNAYLTASTESGQSIRLIRLDSSGNEVFDQVIMLHGVIQQNPKSFIKNNHLVTAFMDENNFGVPRLKVYSHNETGEEIFAHAGDDDSHDAIFNFEQSEHPDGIDILLNLSTPEVNLKLLTLDQFGQLISEVDHPPGDSGNLRAQTLTNDPSGIRLSVTSQRRPFPEFTSDTRYLYFNSSGEICENVFLEGVDFGSIVQYHDGFFHELRYIGQSELHVIKHGRPQNCLPDEIFTNGFD